MNCSGSAFSCGTRQCDPKHLLILFLLHFATFILATVTTLSTPAQARVAGVPYPDDINRIIRRGHLIVAQYQGIEPLFFFDEPAERRSTLPSVPYGGKRLVGVDISLALAVASHLGVALELRKTATSFDEVCSQVARDEADLGISALSITQDRATFVRFSAPYAQFKLGLLINRKMAAADFFKRFAVRAHPEKLLDNPSCIIAVQQDTAHETLARELFPHATIVLYPGIEDSYKAVAEGRALATVSTDYFSGYLFRNDPKLGLVLKWIPFPSVSDSLAVAVSPRNPNLLSYVNVVVQKRKLLTNPEESFQEYRADWDSASQRAQDQAEAGLAEGKTQSGTSLITLIFGTCVLLAGLLVIWQVLSKPRSEASDREPSA